MKTSEFIKLLQDADPSGETHIRLDGGIPYYVEPKPGYYDGPYSYLDDDGNWVYTTQGDKIDIYCYEPEDIAEKVLYQWNEYTEGTDDLWDKVKAKFKFRLTYAIEEHRKEREDAFLKPVKQFLDDMIPFHKKQADYWYKETTKAVEDGYRFFKKYKGDKFSNWIEIKDGEPSGVCFGRIGVINKHPNFIKGEEYSVEEIIPYKLLGDNSYRKKNKDCRFIEYYLSL